MDQETIAMLFKWVPWALIGIVFLFFFIGGVIKGRYRTIRRLLYVIIYMVIIWLFIMPITKMVLDINVTINGVQGVRNYIVKFLEENETINDFFSYSKGLKETIISSPEIIVAPVIFLVLVFVGLPLSFPIYIVYSIIYNVIARVVFKREKYQKDENGDILRNEKKKKVKIKRSKHRLSAGLIKGVQGVAVCSTILLPVNCINRVYNEAKSQASIKKGETLCDTVDSLKDYAYICGYIDMYDDTIFAKVSGEKSLDKVINDRLTTTEANGEKISLEHEVKSVANTAVLLNEAGLLELFMSDSFDIDKIDFSKLNFDKLDKVIDVLFDSMLLKQVVEAGVDYVFNEVLNDKLVEVLKDDDIVSKLSYNGYKEIKAELKDIVDIFRYAVTNELEKTIISNRENVVSIVNNINENNVGVLINKLLSLRIVSRAMPSVLKAYGEQYGVNSVEKMSEELNNEISNTIVYAIKFVKTMELSSFEDLTNGNLLDNLSNSLFEEDKLKENSKDSLATVLHSLNSSYLFKDVVPTSLNKLLEEKDYNIDARVLKYVDSKEAWIKELEVLEKGYSLYKDYKDTDTVYYDKVTSLLNSVSSTKVMISVLPFAYSNLLPQLGIELEDGVLPSIDFDGDNENASKIAFYETWEDELVVLKEMADALGELQLQSLDDLSMDIIKDEAKVESLSKAMGAVYKSDMLREPVVGYMSDVINDFSKEYDITFTKEELLTIDSASKWENEFTNINKIINIDLNDVSNINSEKLQVIFDAVGDMELFRSKKIEILKYAVSKSDFLSDDEYNSIVWPSSEDQEEIDAFWDNETSVLLKVVDKKDKIESLASTSIDSMSSADIEEIGGIVNDVMKSNILKSIVVNKVSDLLISNGVSDDRDNGSSVEYLKQSINSVEDWKIEIQNIKSMLDIDEASMSTVVDGKTKIERVFDTIETSTLLANTRATLLLKAIKEINITEIPSSVTKDVLKDNNYSKYNNEKNIIIKISNEKSAFDGLSSMELETMDTSKIGNLLDTVSTSIIFKDYLVEQVKTVLVSNGVKDDRDAEGTSNLENSIASVSAWGDELEIIKKMVNIGDSYDSKVGTKTNVEIIFDSIESSELLRNTRANLLIKAINIVGIEGVSSSSISVNDLVINNYAQYDKEVNVFVAFAENKDAINTLDITELNSSNKTMMANVLNAMKESIVFENKYVNTIDSSLNTIRSNSDLNSYGVSLKSKTDANNYKNIEWNSEINNLLTINDNISLVKGYDSSSISSESQRNETISVIGETLDAVAACSLFAANSDQSIANSVANQLSNGLITSISKNDSETWSQAFNRVFNA